MKLWSSFLVLAFALPILTGCEARGFRLPNGNIQKGKQAFVALHCNDCHKVAGVELPPPVSTVATNVTLGGEVTYIKSYGELVTCVINPSHELAAGFKKTLSSESGKLSPMPEFNNVMTVQQMIDIVAFLRSTYSEHESRYMTYSGGLPVPLK